MPFLRMHTHWTVTAQSLSTRCNVPRPTRVRVSDRYVSELLNICLLIYITIQKSRVCKMFLKEMYYAYQGCIYLIKNTVEKILNCEILLQYYKIIVFFY